MFKKEGVYKEQPLPRGERVHARYPVAIGRSRITGASAEMVITDRHLILNPLNMDGARAILRAFGALGAPGMGALAGAQQRYELPTTRQIHAADIWGFEPIEGRPPGIRVTLSNGVTLDLMVSRSIGATVWDKRNLEARDNAARLLDAITRPYRR